MVISLMCLFMFAKMISHSPIPVAQKHVYEKYTMKMKRETFTRNKLSETCSVMFLSQMSKGKSVMQ